MTTYQIRLINDQSGELDNVTVECDEAALSEHVARLIHTWFLASGDTIRITEVQP